YDLAQFVVGHVGAAHDVVIEHDGAVLANGAHGELAPAGNAELANDDDVEWGVECLGNLGGNGQPAARKPQHDRIVDVNFGHFDPQQRAGRPTVVQDVTVHH